MAAPPSPAPSTVLLVSSIDTFRLLLVSINDTNGADETRTSAIIRRFKDRAAEAVFNGRCPKGFPADIFGVARRKLEALNAATGLNDLRAPPSNRLEALKGDRAGQHSIRINDQWRVCFRWTAEGPTDVEVVDYH